MTFHIQVNTLTMNLLYYFIAVICFGDVSQWGCISVNDLGVSLRKSVCHSFVDHRRAHFVKACRDSSCLRCWESSFFSRDRRIQALARPTSVLISDILWMCLKRQTMETEDHKNPPSSVWCYLLTGSASFINIFYMFSITAAHTSCPVSEKCGGMVAIWKNQTSSSQEHKTLLKRNT